MAGLIIKQIGKDRCFHFTIMPCFDKKLEASRTEFVTKLNDTDDRVKDVDLVLATNELFNFLESHCSGFFGLNESFVTVINKQISLDGDSRLILQK